MFSMLGKDIMMTHSGIRDWGRMPDDPHIDGLLQDCSNSSADAVIELL